MELANKIVSLADEGFVIRFEGGAFYRGLKVRVSKSNLNYEEFIGYDKLCSSISGSDYVLMYVIDKLVYKINRELKGSDE